MLLLTTFFYSAKHGSVIIYYLLNPTLVICTAACIMYILDNINGLFCLSI